MANTFEKGDRLTFKSATRDGCRKATRTITGVSNNAWGECPEVTYAGWYGFVVRPDEIINIERKETTE